MTVRGSQWPVFLLVSCGVFLSTLDSSMVNVALPSIMEEFSSTLHATEWVVISYLLTTSTTLLVWGHFSDRWGRNRFYTLGFFIFGSGALACAVSPSLATLIAARFLQALGAAMLMANGPALIRQIFPAHQLGRFMGLIGVAVSLGLMCGPLAGGLLIEFFSWRALFFLSPPLCLLLALAGLAVLPDNSFSAPRQGTFDLSGALLWAALLASLSFLLTHGTSSHPPRSATPLLALFVPGAFSLLIFVEQRADDPILPPMLLRKSFFLIGVTSALFSFLILFSALILVPFYLNHVLGLSASTIGMVMLTIPATALLVAPVAGWLSDSLGARLLSTTGLLCSSTGLFLLALLGPHSSPLSVAARLILLGMGQALFLSPNSSSVLGSMGLRTSGTAAALLATARNLGMMLGVAISGLLFSMFFQWHTGGFELHHYDRGMAIPFCQALRDTFLCFSVLGLLASALSWRRPAHIRPLSASDA